MNATPTQNEEFEVIDQGDSFDDFISSLENEPLPAAQKPGTRQKFPCGQCGGTGKYRGARVHQTKSHCFACKGLGYFLTDPRKLQARREQKAKKQVDVVSTFILGNEELIVALGKIASWNSFAASMLAQLGLDVGAHPELSTPRRIEAMKEGFRFRGGKPLSEKQVAACRRMLAKIEERNRGRDEERKTSQVSVDLGPIRAMFETAVQNGYKKPTYRAEGLVINRAPDTGNNPGALYVKDEAGEYVGKILGTTFMPTRNAAPAGQALLAIAADPLAAALRHGQRTGRCACCGRELTKHTSIEAGIGPICKEKWGL